jgi:hypothetical protein
MADPGTSSADEHARALSEHGESRTADAFEELRPRQSGIGPHDVG